MEKKIFLLIGFLCLYLTGLCFTPPYLLQPENQIRNISTNQTFSWVTNNELQRYELKINECEYEQGSSSNSINLNEFEYLRDQHISNVRKISGLTWAEGYRYPLVMCADEYLQLHAFDQYSLRSTVFNWLNGFISPGNYDYSNFGGITHLYNHHHILADEATGNITYVEFDPQTYSTILRNFSPNYDLNININNSEQGIEGIAYNQFTNSVYVAKEKSPMSLYEFKAASAPNFASAPGNLSQPFNLETAARTWNIKNVSGLFHLSKSPALNGTAASNNLLVLSSESRVLIECDLNGKEISRLNLNTNGANGTLSNALANAKGVSYANGIVYILSSPAPGQNAKVFAFSNKNYKESSTVIGTQIYSNSNIQGGSHRVSNLRYEDGKSYCWNIVGTNSAGQKFKSNYFSFGETAPPPPPVVKTISLKKPTLNSAYRPGETISIEWEQNIDFKVNVYFYNGTTIVRTPGINIEGRKLNFVIPSNSLTGNNYSIRVAVAEDESVYDDNRIRVDANQITITRPTPNLTFEPNKVISIEWIQNVDFRVNVDFYNGSSRLQNIATNFNGRKYSFKIPSNSLSGNNYSVRVSSTSNTANYASRSFSIKPPPPPDEDNEGTRITISSPSAGQSYLPGSTLPVRWNYSSASKVTITLKSYDDEKIYEFEKNYINSGSYNVSVPYIPKSSRYYIEVRSVANNSILSRSGEFTIAPRAGLSNVKLSNGYLGNTSRYMPGDDITLTWNDNISGDIIIQLFDDNGWVSGFAADNRSDGYERITLKPSLPITYETNYRIRIISRDDNTIYAFSEYFKITPLRAFVFTTPATGTYDSRGIIQVRWENLVGNTNALGRVKITLMQGSELIKPITINTANDGLYFWIPGSNTKDGNNYRLLMESATVNGFVALSPVFSLKGGQAKLMEQVDFSIAPNPATDFINISFDNTLDKTVDLKLYNANGACLKSVIVDEENLRLDVSAFPPGYYYLNIRDDKNNINKKILIE